MGNEHDHEHDHDHDDPQHRHDDASGDSATDMTPSGPHGTGDTDVGTAHGNEETQRPTTGVDETGRPTGVSRSSDSTGVGESDPIDDDSPHLPPA